MLIKEKVWQINEEPFDLTVIEEQFIEDLKSVAPDLASNNLAERYTSILFGKLNEYNPSSEEDLVRFGEMEFYKVGKEAIGPLAVKFVHDTLKQITNGKVLFLARDATPFFHIAKILLTQNPNEYDVTIDDILNPVLHRKFWDVDDEQDTEEAPLSPDSPILQKYYKQLGFGNGQMINVVDVGAWGSMTDFLKKQNPDQAFQVFFFYSHLPDHIYGYINLHSWGIDETYLEAIADTWEAFPKVIKRQTKLLEKDGKIIPSADGKILDSKYMHAWSKAALKGLEDAALAFANGVLSVEPNLEIEKLARLSDQANQGLFTGVLPEHTQTWTEGETWKANWPWGKILPLTG